MKRLLLIIGANGQLGKELQVLSKTHDEFDYVFTDMNELDITHSNEVNQTISHLKPFAVINCAAYTAVDKAESEAETAYLVNEHGVRNLAIACKQHQSLLVHISTDYVFDGKTHLPYNETDTVSPLGIYGKSKAAGELAVTQSGTNFIIIRTSWLYSTHGHNFVKTMLRYGNEKPELHVVTDQVGSPTNARCLAKAILFILPKIKDISKVQEILHFTNTGIASWYDFAVTIFELANMSCKVNPIPTSSYPLPAPRPYYSVLNTEKIRQQYNIDVLHWKLALKHCIDQLISEK